MQSSFSVKFDDLPGLLPVFPLPSVLLLPGGRLPLNIFEQRYVQMLNAALATPHKLIGMIQPKASISNADPELHEVGCLGKITSFEDTPDGRYLIDLNGLSRCRT